MKTKKKEAEKTNITALRPPIVTLMGHVDHGKTSLLDAIRSSNLTGKESGGITQHTGAYSVVRNGKKITFIDTPGHEAFTQMRARGGKAADIVILVVAADDGVMPQTKEAIIHAKAAEVPIVVAINKMDLATANIKKVKRQLSEEGILLEGYGGDVVSVEVSAKENRGIEELLDVLSLVAEMNPEPFELKPNAPFEALVIEAKHDSKKGVMVSAVIKNGELNLREEVYTNGTEGKIKNMLDSNGKALDKGVPGDAVEILGFSDVPEAGDLIHKKAERELIQEHMEKVSAENKETINAAVPEENGKKNLNLVVRADTQGTLEALTTSLKKIKVEGAECNVLLAGTGDVKESDILLASSAKGIVLAFRVKASSSAKELALSKKIIIREYDIIYKLLEEIEGALEGVLEIEESKIKGKGFVIKVFTLPRSGMLVIGTLIEAGKFKVKDRVGIFRGEEATPLYISRVRSLHVGANEVDQAVKGQECGILLKPQIEDIKLDDVIQIF